ncbi:glutamine amino acid ABC transporter GlnP [Streptococcus equi subsp. zooepidemicus MGCS10565]|nr:glutamine amino acid ABC transporter GlnP [Streptococcus equi subsp. zooepidemicus MGCS10565]
MELWNGAQSVVAATYLPITPLLFAAFYYLMITTILSQLLGCLERKLAQGGR